MVIFQARRLARPPDIPTAIAVGKRHGKAAALEVQALQMHRCGFKFFLAENKVWLTDFVPADSFSQSASRFIKQGVSRQYNQQKVFRQKHDTVVPNYPRFSKMLAPGHRSF